MKPMLIVVGKSGSGKNFLLESFNLNYTPGYTTRQKRPNDNKNLKHVPISYFGTKPYFGETQFDGNTYWTLIEDYNDIEYDFAILSKEGLINFLNKYKKNKILFKRNYNIIYIKCNLFKRILNMKKRKDSYKKIFKRILHDIKAFQNIEKIIKENKGIVIEN